MITPQGTVKVMDFGIARAVSDSAATMTSTAAVIGTAQYLSPEQARGEGVDARSDVYSLGCMLYELVTGAPPFTGDSPVAVAYQHVREDPRLPSSINPEVPPELDAILLKALSKNPANRYQSAADMRTDLLRALAGQRVEATPVLGDTERTTYLGAAGASPAAWTDGEDDARRRRRTIAIVAAVLAVLLIGAVVAAVALTNRGSDTPTVTQVAVPDVVGRSQADATAQITSAGLALGAVTTAPDATVPQGSVVSTDPAGGAQVAGGSKVALVVSGGPDTIAVPRVVGLPVDGAQSNLAAAGFTDVQTRRVDSTTPAGQVVAVDPAEGSAAARDAQITLSVSRGTAPIPDVKGQSQDAALRTLRSAGFTNVTVESAENDAVPQGAAVGTQPGTGTAAAGDDQITLLIAEPTPTEPTTTAPTTTAPTTTTAPSSTSASRTTTTPSSSPSTSSAGLLPLPTGGSGG
jgi:serine/threonine-protein kinase